MGLFATTRRTATLLFSGSLGRMAFVAFVTILLISGNQQRIFERQYAVRRAQDIADLLKTSPTEKAASIIASENDPHLTIKLERPSPERLDHLETLIAPYLDRAAPHRAAYAAEGDAYHDFWRISIPVNDGQWVSIETKLSAGVLGDVPPFAAVFIAITAAITVGSVLALRRLTEPLRALESAAIQFGRDLDAPPLDEQGPGDIRRVAAAFNQMQARLRRFISDRTTMLAAVSHDLRSPLQRLKFRADYMEDAEQREKMLRDIADMETMIAATLDFARADNDGEPAAMHDLAGILASVAEDLRECGYQVTLVGAPAAMLYPCRGRALRRAIENLAVNAATYGSVARLSIRQQPPIDQVPGEIAIEVADDGPGVPEPEMERVFAPFYRLESSRNAHTGGTGLGLSIARSIARAHGGDIKLQNRAAGGLTARLFLPA
jgi:signal transduction histidine kinase